FGAASGQFFIADQQVDAAVGDVDEDLVAVVDQTDGAARGGFRRGVTDGQARRATGETAVGEQGAGLAQALGLQVAGRVEHFLHARAALRTFVADDHDIAGFHLVAEDALDRAVLALEHLGGAFEYVDRLVDAGGLHHAAVEGDVAVQHGQAAFLRVGVLDAADAAVLTVDVQVRPAGALAERGLGGDAGRTCLEEVVNRFVPGLGDVPLGDGFGHVRAVYGVYVGVQQAATGQFAEDGEDAAGAVHVFHVVLLDVRRHLAQLRHLARQAIDVAQIERHFRFLRCGQQVQDGVGRTAHGDVQHHGVLERLDVGDVARQYRLVAFPVVALAQL